MSEAIGRRDGCDLVRAGDRGRRTQGGWRSTARRRPVYTPFEREREALIVWWA